MAGMGSFGPPSPVPTVIMGRDRRWRGGNGGRPPLTMKKRPRGPGAAAPGRGSGAAPPRPKHPARPIPPRTSVVGQRAGAGSFGSPYSSPGPPPSVSPGRAARTAVSDASGTSPVKEPTGDRTSQGSGSKARGSPRERFALQCGHAHAHRQPLPLGQAARPRRRRLGAPGRGHLPREPAAGSQDPRARDQRKEPRAFGTRVLAPDQVGAPVP